MLGVAWADDLVKLAGTEGTHLVLGALIFFSMKQFREMVDKILQLQERLTGTNERLDLIESSRLDPMDQRLVAIQERIDRLHPPKD